MQTLLNDAASRIQPADPKGLEDFLTSFCGDVPDDDLRLMAPDTLLATARTHLALATAAQPGRTALKIHTIHVGGEGADATRTAIDIVNDDMPFIVDSVAAELARHRRTIQLLLHPILENAGDRARSHIHVELLGTLTEPQARQLTSDLERVLDDVQRATRDWQAMRSALQQAKAGLENGAAKMDREALQEYLAFLDYLYNDNFTLIGARFHPPGGKVPCDGLGLLSDGPDRADPAQDLTSPDQVERRGAQEPLTVSKLNARSTVHRSVPMDAVVVKQYGADGAPAGEWLFIGLFTSVTYSRSIQDIPYLRRKADRVTADSGFQPGSHDYKALRHILEKYPRDELFQIPSPDLLSTALSILQLQERPRIALYLRPDAFGRYISCLVYVPRDRYDTRLRVTMQQMLERTMGGQCSNFYTTLDDSPLARIIYMIDTPQGQASLPSREDIEATLQDAGRAWSDRLHEALRAYHADEDAIADFANRYGAAFPVAYGERYEPRQAVHDIAKIEQVLENGGFALDFYRDKFCEGNEVRLKIYMAERPIILSDALPLLENLGLKVISELPFHITPAGAPYAVWIHDFLMLTDAGKAPIKVPDVKALFEDALGGIVAGTVENDSLNELVIQARMGWQQIQILRAYVRYMRQAQYPFGTLYIERALTQNADIAGLIVSLFDARFAPDAADREQRCADLSAQIMKRLESVVSLDVDRILRTVVGLVTATLRTNAYQTDAQGQPRPYLSLKLDSRAVSILPEPRPFREVFVYSPRMEGIHLRMDWIARGGIRWSDRAEDFRTEVLGLMKAQQVKNAVIVPMGAKGGFIVKNPPKAGGREAFQAEGIECYKILVRGLLDITDNRVGASVVPPRDTVRYDQDDPYLVVAADKGTATFSDIANGLSLEYGFWLGDAFASGGSAGYDHKGMGITARGAWESVKRHFRERGLDTQAEPFDVVGVGDMGGDVFGNGMLQSDQMRLVGAFNHLHIFCDPNPDPAASFTERKRLFDAAKGWDQYDTTLLSTGGRIYLRTEKTLELTDEIKARFGLTEDRVAPSELIQAMLRADTDLLFFGGIGTYVKATTESHADVGDKTNDTLRVNGDEIRAKVVGEGANLALTQLARVEMAKNRVALNTDFVDNSAGVDTSDHEVNIKILFAEVMENDAGLTVEKRNKLQQDMTDEVARLVLRDNYQQTQGLSLAQAQCAETLGIHAAFIRDLERHSNVSRRLEGLPDEEAIERRRALGKGLTRPELSVLTSYAKILFTRDLMGTSIPDDPDLSDLLVNYFPTPMRDAYGDAIRRHRLRREIVATALANDVVNRMGPTFVKAMMDKTGASCADVARAFAIVTRAFGLATLWQQIEALDNRVPANAQIAAMIEISRMAEREVTWFLTRLGHDPAIGESIRAYGSGIERLRDGLAGIATPELLASLTQRETANADSGLPDALARHLAVIPLLGAACDIIRISSETDSDILEAGRAYFQIGAYFHLDWLREQAQRLPASGRWADEALHGLVEQLHVCQAGLTAQALTETDTNTDNDDADRVAGWVERRGHQARRLRAVIDDMRKSGVPDLPMLILAEQRLRHLYGG